MRVLLDENLPHDLRRLILGHEVFTVAYMDYDSLKNGELLRRAASDGFGVLITMDSKLEFEQNLGTLPLAVIVLRAVNNQLETIKPLVPAVLAALATIEPRTLVVIED